MQDQEPQAANHGGCAFTFKVNGQQVDESEVPGTLGKLVRDPRPWKVHEPPVVRRVAAPRRTNGQSGRPRAQATRSSARSGDSPDDEPGEPPAAALDAVAAAWTQILRARYPRVSWRTFVADVWDRTAEREIERERETGLSR